MSPRRIAIVFTCLGNICRSPLAESVFRDLVRQRGVEDRFEIDSAGTAGYHIGHPPDARTVATARARGLAVTGSARQLTGEDLNHYDYVIVMDRENLENVERLRAESGGGSASVRLLRDWDPEGSGEVPDPYYGGDQGFEEVHDIVERSCAALLDELLESASG